MTTGAVKLITGAYVNEIVDTEDNRVSPSTLAVSVQVAVEATLDVGVPVILALAFVKALDITVTPRPGGRFEPAKVTVPVAVRG